jgi:hypothetical protein
LDSTTPHDPQQGVVAHGQKQALCEALSRSSAQSQPEMMNNPLETRGSPRERSTNRALKSLGENLPPAFGDEAAEAPGADGQHDTPTLRWKVGQYAPISAVDTGRPCPAERAGSSRIEGRRTDPQPVRLGFIALNGQPARRKRYSMTHDGGSRPIRRPRSGKIASAMSLSHPSTPIWGQTPADSHSIVRCASMPRVLELKLAFVFDLTFSRPRRS